jgi:Xaa-Pro aminopeptidase
MAERAIDALVVSMEDGVPNPAMRYLTSCAPLTVGHLVWKRNEPPVLVHGDMERDQAAATGLRTLSYSQLELREITKTEPDRFAAATKVFRRILERCGVGGRVAFYGTQEMSGAYHVLRAIDGNGITIVNDFHDPMLQRARVTKDEDEVAAIRSAGKPVHLAYERIVAFCRALTRRGDGLFTTKGERATVGDLKRIVRTTLSEAGYEGEAIVAQGPDSAVPHNHGDPDRPLEVGRTIIVDIFPAPAIGGYFFDVTRTFVIGSADDGVKKLYADVREALRLCMGMLRIGGQARDLQVKVCEFFESRGHPTIGSDPKTHDGYVHGLGHGVGLQVHERPSLSDSAANTDRLEAGNVVTIEPGLYYPERNAGVRLEDIVYLRPDGTLEVLSTFPLDLVVPCQGP